jgi:hypothetical protein
MYEHAQPRETWQGKVAVPIVFMAMGVVFLAASTFILATVGSPAAGILAALQALAIPSIPIGAMLLLLGLVNTTKKPSLSWLRRTVSILGGILLGLAALWFLLVLVLFLSGF